MRTETRRQPQGQSDPWEAGAQQVEEGSRALAGATDAVEEQGRRALALSHQIGDAGHLLFGIALRIDVVQLAEAVDRLQPAAKVDHVGGGTGMRTGLDAQELSS